MTAKLLTWKCMYAKWCAKVPYLVWTNNYSGEVRYYCAEHSSSVRRRMEPIFLSSWRFSFAKDFDRTV